MIHFLFLTQTLFEKRVLIKKMYTDLKTVCAGLLLKIIWNDTRHYCRAWNERSAIALALPRAPFSKESKKKALPTNLTRALWFFKNRESLITLFFVVFCSHELKAQMFCVRNLRHLPTKSALKTAFEFWDRTRRRDLRWVEADRLWCEIARCPVCALGTCTYAMISRLPPALTVVF